MRHIFIFGLPRSTVFPRYLKKEKKRSKKKTWMEGVQAAMTTRNLEPDQWRNREEWRLVSGRRRQLLKNQTDR